jgi:hypothetical protein
MVRYCNKALSMILLLYNLLYMFYTYVLHPNFVVTKYGRDRNKRQLMKPPEGLKEAENQPFLMTMKSMNAKNFK